jgi:general secretion pathway protein D
VKKVYLYLVLLFSFGVSSIAQAEEQKQQTWKINLKEAEIRAFITQVADITEKSFVIDPRVKGKVTVISHSSLSQDAVYELFLSVLHVHNFAAVPSVDGLVKIVPSNTATKDTIRFDFNNSIEGEELITRVIAVNNSSASELIPVLRPMVAQHGHLAAVPSANAIIISDHGANIERIMSIIDKIDGAESEEIEVIQLKEAWVTDIVTLLESLTPVETGKSSSKRGRSSSSSVSSRVRVVADERTNRLILKGEKSARARVRLLVEKLDTPSESASGSTQVIYLRYGDAKKVAEILTSLVSKSSNSSAASGSRGQKNAEDLTRAPTYIQADDTLNALVVKADPASMEEIQDIVRQLDVRRAQVLIEAAIIEVKGDIGHALGVQWGFTDPNGSAPSGGVNSSVVGNSLNSLFASASGVGALTGDVGGLSEGLSAVGGKTNRNGDFQFGAFLQAVTTTSNTNILSTPSIVTMDNAEAEIIVGQEVPITTGSQTTGASTGLLTTTERKDVGLTLKVTPRIHEGDTIRLEIDQQSSDLSTDASAVESGANTITTKRSIKTTILAKDREFIVLGGLVREDDTESVSKVPLLGDIPFIGVLFRSTQKTREKTNLMVFLKPTILRDGNTLSTLSQNKYQSIRELQLEINDKNGSISLYKEKDFPEDIQDVWIKSSPQGGKVDPKIENEKAAQDEVDSQDKADTQDKTGGKDKKLQGKAKLSK